MTETVIAEDQGLTLPYGPTKGMMQALQMMRKTTPAKVDGNYLRLNKIAPGNEYKVIGALRFLGIIDDEGNPTDKSRLLKTKGPTFTSALQHIVRTAYRDVFQALDGRECSQEDIYNHFVTESGLGPEMAAKTTRFFIQLCRLAEIDLGLAEKHKLHSEPKKGSNGHRKHDVSSCPAVSGPAMVQFGASHQFPLFLALTPELASMDTEQLTGLFRKLRMAYAQACEE